MDFLSSDNFRHILEMLFYQRGMIGFAWGANDPFWIMMGKRALLLLPCAAILAGTWASAICIATVLFRQQRHEFLISLVITWWDLGKSIFSFWGGIFKFLFCLVGSLFGLAKFLIMGVWIILQDLFLVPFRVFGNLAGTAMRPGIPWVAVWMTVFWCFLEAAIFTYVTTPLAEDVISNLTGEMINPLLLRMILFSFLLILVMGSYAVLSNFTEAVKSRDVPSIVKISAVEFVAMMVEILFLYREFVASLAPWFSQYSEGFVLGIFGTIMISTLAWLGVRGMSWFLFASHGIAAITAFIKRDASQLGNIMPQGAAAGAPTQKFELSLQFSSAIKQEMDWLKKKGEELMDAAILPGMQILGATVNFVTLALSSKHLFALPFKSMREIAESKDLLRAMNQLKAHQESRRVADVSGLHKVPNALGQKHHGDPRQNRGGGEL